MGNEQTHTGTYAILHCHTELSTCTTNVDSVTSYGEYIDHAVQDGLYGVTFTEHGNVFEWFHKKQAIEKAGFKYIHAVEAYITEDEPWFPAKGKDPPERHRDNYHCCLYAKNHDGFRELNRLISQSFNRADVDVVPGVGVHYYYRPRITYDELKTTSDNIIVSTACMAGILSEGSDDLQADFIEWLTAHRDRCYLEVQHHPCEAQAKYNRKLADISHKTGIPLLACTDTHSLNEEKALGRSVLQKSKKTFFENEADWDLTYKTYDELVAAFEKQGTLTPNEYMAAIQNTLVLTDSCEEYEIDTSVKYPHISDEPVGALKRKVNEAYKTHPYVKERYSFDQIKQRVNEEFEVYEKIGACDFMLMQIYIREWEKANGIQCGYGRGSVTGSLIAYMTGVTAVDPLKYNLNFFRFLSPDRVSNADIDTDYSEKDRARVKQFMLRDHLNLPNVHTCEIAAFGTIQLKGAIRDIARALNISLDEASTITDLAEHDVEGARKKYPELFNIVDIVDGTVVSMGTHPSGVLVADINIAEEIGLCSLGTTKYPVSMLSMRGLDEIRVSKWDVLGLDNIGIINDTCKYVGIPRVTPDTVDLEDDAVWNSIRDDCTGIFQWESDSAQAYMRKVFSDKTIAAAKKINPHFTRIEHMALANGLLRPGAASYRDDVADGKSLVTGFESLDEFLASSFGHLLMQETFMQFTVKYCGYTNAESDFCRKCVSKKKGTEQLIPEMHKRFVEYSHEHYDEPIDHLEEIWPGIERGILDSANYSFSWNHSDAYSMIGYISGYLRYYYPKEFITAALNTFADKPEKTLTFTEYAKRNKIQIHPIKFRHSRAEYSCDDNAIYKGIASIKHLNKRAADDLYKLRGNQYNSFVDLLIDIRGKTRVDSRQLEILTRLDFFSEFGDIHYLLAVTDLFDKLYGRLSIHKDDELVQQIGAEIIKNHSPKITEKQYMQIDSLGLLRDAISSVTYEPCTVFDHIEYEDQYLGYINYTMSNLADSINYVREVKKVYKNYIVTLYQLNSGHEITVKVKGPKMERNTFAENDIIRVRNISREKKWKRDANGNWVRSDEYEDIMNNWNYINADRLRSADAVQ